MISELPCFDFNSITTFLCLLKKFEHTVKKQHTSALHEASKYKKNSKRN